MKIIVSGGGTGGHIYPALSIIENCDPSDEVLYVGNRKSMESEIVPKQGIKFESINIRGFYRKDKIKNIGVLFQLIIAMIQSFMILIKFKPDVVVGTGGYVSGPVVFVASILGKKTYIHEQNAFPGLTNRLLSRVVKEVFISYEDSRKRFNNKNVTFTGNPVRKSFKEAIGLGISQSKDTIQMLSFGGSGGAQVINDLVLKLIKKYNGHNKFRLVHGTGRKYYEGFMKKIDDLGLILADNVVVKDYISDMPKLMNNSDIVISRAGAITISELIYTRTPSILIPSPNVTDDHQKYNALSMAEKGYAFMLLEENVNVQEIERILENPKALNLMMKKLEQADIQDAGKLIYQKIKDNN